MRAWKKSKPCCPSWSPWPAGWRSWSSPSPRPLIAWKIIGIWQGTLGLLPEFDNAIVGVASPWNPFYTFLLTCFLCILGALPMLRDRRNLGLPRLLIELVYLILSLYLLYAIYRVVFASFAPGI